MGRPARVPDRGDVALSVAAQHLGLPLADFNRLRPELEARGFPLPDPTTGRYCIEAVDRWRLLRHLSLFPELTAAPARIHAAGVIEDRLRAMEGTDGG